MRVILDTHLLLWTLIGSVKLPATARERIASGNDDIYASAVSIAEVAIKHLLKRGRADDMPISGHEATSLAQRSGILALPLSSEDAAALDRMPPLHGDPFDRLLVAQAMRRGMVLMTHDATLEAYGPSVLLV